jgi:class I fructose-bisphosphate aldolase
MPTLGKTVHIRRLQNPTSGHIFTVALDHAPSYGILSGLEEIRSRVDLIAGCEPDAMLLMQGVAERCFAPYAGKIALILKCSMLSPYHPQEDVLVSPVETALRLGAEAVAMAVTVGSPHQAQILADLGRLVAQAERVGLPVIAHAYPNGELVPPDERYTVEQVGYASRLAMELGVDVIKTFYTGSPETFARVVEMVWPAMVVAAGGPRLDSDLAVLDMARNVVQAGAAGVTFGRNIWQSQNPAGMVQALKAVIHNGVSPQAALSKFVNSVSS